MNCLFNTLNISSNTLCSSFRTLSISLGSIPAAYFISSCVFVKISHIVKYVLIKFCGNYAKCHRIEDKVIVTLPSNKDHYIIQNIAIASLLITTSVKAAELLQHVGYSKVITTALLIGSITAVVFRSLGNIVAHFSSSQNDSDCHLEVSETQLKKHSINKNELPLCTNNPPVYSSFGWRSKYLQRIEISEIGKQENRTDLIFSCFLLCLNPLMKFAIYPPVYEYKTQKAFSKLSYIYEFLKNLANKNQMQSLYTRARTYFHA